MPVEKNKEYIVDIIDMGFSGEGIAKINDFTIFIPGAIIGEKIKILVVKVLSSYAFGKVIEGMDIVHKIEAVEVKTADEGKEDSASSEKSTPVTPPVIKSIIVDTKGIDYGMPKTLTPFDYTSWLYKLYGIDPSSFTTTE